jgi:sigma-E factor negative regulatory protein RseA
MSTHPDPSLEMQRAALSALMDGEGSATDDACRAWRGEAAARADWHAYHLIGDLMRSDEHRADGARDACFLAAIRQRLASEPVVLAPAAAALLPSATMPLSRAKRARRWMAPTAVAAGFVAVAGAMMVTRVSTPDGAATGLTASAVAPVADVRAAALAVPAVPAVAPTQPTRADTAPMIRNAELDRYLDAHRQYANGAMQVAPAGAVRNAAAAAPGR